MQLNWQHSESIPDLLIPALTIQPLLENAIRYGVECSAERSVLQVSYVESRSSVTIVITNPYHQQSAQRSGNGMALDNIRQRLQLQYGNGASLSFGVVESLYRVKLVLPKR